MLKHLVLSLALHAASAAYLRRNDKFQPQPPTETQCVAIDSSVSDAWCSSNCLYTPPNCPADLCSCSSDDAAPVGSDDGDDAAPAVADDSTAGALIDIIGYYGNSGNAVSSIPLLEDIDGNYNVLILTFASIDGDGILSLDIQGPYEKDAAGLAAAVAAWKAVPDAWGRARRALVSIGGQNGRWPSGVTSADLLAGIEAFLDEYNLDGLNIDLEVRPRGGR